ncbi:MAG: methyltransferase domain-containing protein [Nitrospinota bacterium]
MHPVFRRSLRSRTLAAFPLTRALVRRLRGLASKPRIEQYLRDSREPKLHVGCGRYYLEGWLNADIDLRCPVDIFLDAREPLPFEAQQFQFVFAEHLIEHLTFEEGRRFCREVYRILRPGGVVRLSTPDLQFLLRYYDEPSAEAHAYTEYHTEEFLRLDVRSRALVISNFFYDFGHRLIYDWDLLAGLLREAAFERIERLPVGESPYPELRGIEQHGRDYPFNVQESMVVEAVKPEG